MFVIKNFDNVIIWNNLKTKEEAENAVAELQKENYIEDGLRYKLSLKIEEV